MVHAIISWASFPARGCIRIKDIFTSHRIRAHNGNCDQMTFRFVVECSRYATGISNWKKAQTTVRPFHPLCAVFNRWIMRLSGEPLHPVWNKMCTGYNWMQCRRVTPRVHLSSFFDSPGRSDSCVAQRVVRRTMVFFNWYYNYRIF